MNHKKKYCVNCQRISRASKDHDGMPKYLCVIPTGETDLVTGESINITRNPAQMRREDCECKPEALYYLERTDLFFKIKKLMRGSNESKS